MTGADDTDASGDGRFYYNLTTGQVEAAPRKGQAKDLMGPYPTREAAAAALDQARRRTEAWDDEDRRWDDED